MIIVTGTRCKGGGTFNGKCHWYFLNPPLKCSPSEGMVSNVLLYSSFKNRSPFFLSPVKNLQGAPTKYLNVLQNWYESHSIVTKRNQSNVFIIHECQNYLIANLSLPATIGWVALFFLVVCLSRNGYTSFFSFFVHPCHPCHPITPSSQHPLWCSGPPTLLLC